jgi:DNA replication protein DnaC
MTPTDLTRLDAQLQRLHLPYIQSHYQALATRAAEQQRSHLDYLEQLVDGEATMRENRSIERRIRNARFPVLKSLDDFQSGPKRSTARKSRTCSVWPSSQPRPISS